MLYRIDEETVMSMTLSLVLLHLVYCNYFNVLRLSPPALAVSGKSVAKLQLIFHSRKLFGENFCFTFSGALAAGASQKRVQR